MFDADAFDVELGAPQLKIGGRLYVGRILSFEEFAPFEKRSMELDDPDRQKDRTAWEAAFKALARDYLREVFPPPPWWAVWRRDPVPTMVTHLGLLKALKSFFETQARALKMMVGATSQETVGSASAPKTAAA